MLFNEQVVRLLFSLVVFCQKMENGFSRFIEFIWDHKKSNCISWIKIMGMRMSDHFSSNAISPQSLDMFLEDCKLP